MTKKTRYFMAGSAAILVAGLCTGLVAYYGGGFQALSASSGPTELAYVPADAAVIAYADVGAIMSSELRQRIKEAMPMHEQGREEFQRETGIDIERDVQYVVVAVTPGTHSALLIAKGNFNPTELQVLAVQHGGTVETYRDVQLVSTTKEVNGNGQGGTLAFLEPGLVGIGDTASVKRAIDAKLSATSVTSNDEIMTLVRQIEQSHNAWALGRFDVLTSQAQLPEQIAKQLPPVKWFTTGVHINGGVSGMVRVEALDDESAELLRRQLSGALAFGEMMSRSDVRAAAVLKSLQMSGTGKTVELSFTVPGELLQMVLPKPRDRRRTPVITKKRSEHRSAPGRHVTAGPLFLPSPTLYSHAATVKQFVFFYGTLMAGFDRRRRAGIDHKLTYIGRGSIQAALFDLGLYPAAVPAPDRLVWGEVYEVSDPDQVLAALDEIEGYSPGNPDQSLYSRGEADVTLPDRAHARAWVYFYNAPLGQAPRIASGDYLEHVKAR